MKTRTNTSRWVWKLKNILWFCEDGIPNKHDWYLLPTIMITWMTFYGTRMKTIYIHFIWFRVVRNLELHFSLEPLPTPTSKELAKDNK